MKSFLKNYLYSNLNYKFFIKNYTFLKDLKQISFLAKSMRHSLILQPIEWKKKFLGNTIILAPHADDEIIGLGGTIINSLRDKLAGVDRIIDDEGNRVRKIKESKNSLES